MAIKIGHASIDEHGKISGGKVGDQTGKEICVRSWYDKDWDVLLVCTDEKLAKKASGYMEDICKDPDYGYDQNQRTTGHKSIKANGNKVKGGRGEFDCSSLVSSCYNLAGLDIDVNNTTRSLRKACIETGKFKAYTDSKYLKTDAYARVGALYLKEGSHVVMALENGSKIKNNASTSTTKKTTSANSEEKFNEKYKSGKSYKVSAVSGLHLRQGAGTDKKSLGILKKNTKVTWYGYYTDKNGVTWKKVKVASGSLSGKTGYVSAKYIK